jgi:predicted DNA-binding transcriptional regulator AlpA
VSEGRPAFLSKKSLAFELDVSESTVDEMVRRGVLPKPLRLSPGCIRWNWDSVRASLASLETGGEDAREDPFVLGALNAAKEAQTGRG